MAKTNLCTHVALRVCLLASVFALLAAPRQSFASSQVQIYKQNFDNLAGGPTSSNTYKSVANVSGLPKGTGSEQWTFKSQSWKNVSNPTSTSSSGIYSQQTTGTAVGATSSSQQGLIELTRNFLPNGASEGPNPAVLIMHDSSKSDSDTTFSLNEAILTLDLAGYANIVLSFLEYDANDTEHTSKNLLAKTNGVPYFSDSQTNNGSLSDNPRTDGVSVSSNGTDWYELYSPYNHDGSWLSVTKSISDLIATVANPEKLSATSSFKIKFHQYDNAYHNYDGRKYDNILVTGTRINGGSAPEPATAVMFGLGMAGMALPALRRRFARNAKQSAA